jgi:hypothetical protein
MPPSLASPFRKHFDCLKAPRRHNTRHLLHDILLLALCALISGAGSWIQVAEYGRSKLDWFQEFLALPKGSPSHDTFGRLLAQLDSQGFHDFFTRWAWELAESLQGKTVAMEGKTRRGSPRSGAGASFLHFFGKAADGVQLF